MLRGLPVLIAVAASSTSCTTSHGPAFSGDRAGAATVNCGDKEQAEAFETNFDPRALRPVKNRGARSSRPPLTAWDHMSRCQRGEAGRNGHAMWKVCATCRLRIQYTPAFGSKGTYRQAGPLAPDTDVVLEQVGNTVENDVEAREQLNSKVISVTGASR